MNQAQTKVRRNRDSTATRQSLIDAARELFEEKGYEGATVRAIGERAGVDPALIARYFDNKEGLYIATLADESDQSSVKYAGLEPEEIATRLFARWDERGRTPVARAMASPILDEEVREQIQTLVRLRLRGPLADGLRTAGTDQDPDLAGELLIGAILGICLTRANGALPDLAEADAAEVSALIRRIVASMIG